MMPSLLKIVSLLVTALGLFGCQNLTSRLIQPERRVIHVKDERIISAATEQGLEIQSLEVLSNDGFKIAGLLVTRRGDATRPPAAVKDFLAALPRHLRNAAPGVSGTVLMLHGFRNRKEQWMPMARELAWAGFTCVLIDSRAHGDSGGKYATFGVNEANDTKAIWQRVKQSMDLPNPRLSMMGYSMGGAVALSSLDVIPEVRGVVTMATFDRLDRVMWDQAAPRLHWLTRPALSVVGTSAQVRTGMNPKDIRPVDCVARHTTPLLLIHGMDDRFIHPQASEVLEKLAKGPCRRILVPGKNHWSLFYDEDPPLHAEIAVFLAGLR